VQSPVSDPTGRFCRCRAWFYRPRLHCGRLLMAVLLLATACVPPSPPPRNLPTSPAVLDITPVPTLDIDATATVLAGELRPTATPAGLYVVQPGDTLGTLAEEFGTTVDEILVANGLTDPNDIQEGQELIIPSLLATPQVETPEPEDAEPEDAEPEDAEPEDAEPEDAEPEDTAAPEETEETEEAADTTASTPTGEAADDADTPEPEENTTPTISVTQTP
jgi:LysM repeat protein